VGSQVTGHRSPREIEIELDGVVGDRRSCAITAKVSANNFLTLRVKFNENAII